jgi:hypothetical protein
MVYRVEYNGGDIELTTLDSALDSAKQAIAADLDAITGFTIEHDETINDWFVQGVRSGERVGPTAVVSGPDPVGSPAPTGRVYSAGDGEDWARLATFTGASPLEIFDRAAGWLAARPDLLTVSDVTWHAGELRVYYR